MDTSWQLYWIKHHVLVHNVTAILNQASCTCTQCDSYIESSIMYSYTVWQLYWIKHHVLAHNVTAILNQASCTRTQCDSYIESSIMYSSYCQLSKHNLESVQYLKCAIYLQTWKIKLYKWMDNFCLLIWWVVSPWLYMSSLPCEQVLVLCLYSKKSLRCCFLGC